MATCCANERMAAVDGTGRTVWAEDNRHLPSRFDACSIYPELPGRQIVVDLGNLEEVVDQIHVRRIVDGALLGKLISCRLALPLPDRLRTGPAATYTWWAASHALFDGRGDKVAIFDTPSIDNPNGLMCGLCDLTGNGVPDVLFSADHGSTIYLYRNQRGAMSAPGLPLLTEVNYTLY